MIPGNSEECFVCFFSHTRAKCTAGTVQLTWRRSFRLPCLIWIRSIPLYIPIAHSWTASKKPNTAICTLCLSLPLDLMVIRAGAGHHDCEVHWDGKSRPWCPLQIEKGIRSIKPLRPLSCFFRCLLNRQYDQHSCWYLLAEHHSQDKYGQDLGGASCAFQQPKIGMEKSWKLSASCFWPWQ